jgi:hypothetical protein
MIQTSLNSDKEVLGEISKRNNIFINLFYLLVRQSIRAKRI